MSKKAGLKIKWDNTSKVFNRELLSSPHYYYSIPFFLNPKLSMANFKLNMA